MAHTGDPERLHSTFDIITTASWSAIQHFNVCDVSLRGHDEDSMSYAQRKQHIKNKYGKSW